MKEFLMDMYFTSMYIAHNEVLQQLQAVNIVSLSILFGV